jgi:hypothetical protein
MLAASSRAKGRPIRRCSNPLASRTVLNLKVAKALGIEAPTAILLLADQVIE